jgi:hypothetical protein
MTNRDGDKEDRVADRTIPASTRLFVILARKASMGVVFRRGPSKHVLLINWNTEKHQFRMGQWLKGRIYERRCDLSPSGEKLLYLAANQRAPLFSWTAVSRPPFLTALAMWPNGSAWGGGGLFKNERTVSLNHRPDGMAVADGFRLPKNIQAQSLGTLAGRGEDGPIFSHRLQRDGWTLKQAAEGWKENSQSRIYWEPNQREIWIKPRDRWVLEMSVVGINEKNGPWYVIEHQVLDTEGRSVASLGRSDWADWSQTGELLFARDGCLGRLPRKDGEFQQPEELVDLRQLRFQPRSAPPEAKVWSGRCPRGLLIK